MGLEVDDGEGGTAVTQQEFSNIDREALPCLQVRMALPQDCFDWRVGEPWLRSLVEKRAWVGLVCVGGPRAPLDGC